MLVYRYVKKKYLDDPLSAEGSAKVGGRWNAEGTPMLYTSQSASTAQLEILAGVNEYASLTDFYLVCIYVPDDVFQLTPDDLLQIQKEVDSPFAWDDDIRPEFTVDIGETWFEKQESIALAVPSSLSPFDYNILLNTKHSDFSNVSVQWINPQKISPRIVLTAN